MNDALLAKVWKRTGVPAPDRDNALDWYTRSRKAYDEFAALDAPLLPPRTLDAVQVNLVRWQTRNFGIPVPCEIACGIAEELGERVLANETLDHHGYVDGTGDTMVYACQLATSRRLAFTEVVAAGIRGGRGIQFFDGISSQRILTIGCGYTAHVQLKDRQGIRGMNDPEISRVGTFLGLVMIMRGLDGTDDQISDTFVRVATEVMRRDWVANRVSADTMTPG